MRVTRGDKGTRGTELHRVHAADVRGLASKSPDWPAVSCLPGNGNYVIMTYHMRHMRFYSKVHVDAFRGTYLPTA